ncbi:MAG: 30S ribosomal protein S8 [Candidatus Omnitrophica bacterium]|nr:30S ribosomal protein S8 [Candidatus Omnitrophota bacterium]
MSRTDLIADVFTMIRNAHMAKKENLDVPASKIIKSIVQILKAEGYINDWKPIEDKKQGIVRIYLKYMANGKPAIKKIIRISKPGLRRYVSKDELPNVLRGRGIAIISTSKGIVTDFTARETGAGGEVIGYIW